MNKKIRNDGQEDQRRKKIKPKKIIKRGIEVGEK